MNKDKFDELIKQIYSAVDGLREMFPNKRFTPDGRMVGDIGEVIGQYYYGIELHKTATHKGSDGIIMGRHVQIKCTQREETYLKDEHDLFLVIKIFPDGSWKEIYNGDGKRVWQRYKKSMYDPIVSLRNLLELNKVVKKEDKILRIK